MRKSISDVNKRRDEIFSMILENGEIQVSELSKKLNVSELTIRRDLTFFEDKRLVERFYGGVRLSNPYDDNNPSLAIEKIKKKLAQRASEMINSGDIIFLNSSSTTLYIIQYLTNKEVTIITNNGRALFSKIGQGITVIFTGGELRSPKNAMVGDYALHTLDALRASTTFLGCSGFSIENGMSTSVHSEVSVNKKMIEQTNGKKYIVVDHSKLTHDASFIVADINTFDGIIIDSNAPKELLDEFRNLPDFQVIVVDV